MTNTISQLRDLALTHRQLCDLELLLVGGFAPLTGFLVEKDYTSVLSDMRLASGALWPIPIVLDVEMDHGFTVGEGVVLTDEYGNPLARLDIASIYAPDKEAEARMVYGTTDPVHAGVAQLLKNTKPVYLGGTVHTINTPKRYDFLHLRKTPEQVRAWKQQQGYHKLIGFQTRNPLHRAHVELVRQAARRYDAPVLVHPVVGETKEGDIDYRTRVRVYQHIYERFGNDFMALALLPLAMRMAGPREALWHAIIRKNYGCTHFIVGRDHAGPGKDTSGKPFYGPYEAQDLVAKYADELGIEMVAFEEMVYVKETDAYVQAKDVAKGHTVLNISGTEFRRMLRAGEPIPAWFSYPEVIDELRQAVEREKCAGIALFFTGLSGSGKSTLAHMLADRLREIQHREVSVLDGDVVRRHLSKGLTFSKADRDTNIERIGFVASEIVRHGGIVLCAAIAPYTHARRAARNLVEQHGLFVEVYVSTPLSVCKKRDVKGLYEKAEQGIIKGLTGVDDPYETPERAELVLDTSTQTPEECVEQILGYLTSHTHYRSLTGDPSPSARA